MEESDMDSGGFADPGVFGVGVVWRGGLPGRRVAWWSARQTWTVTPRQESEKWKDGGRRREREGDREIERERERERAREKGGLWR